ncbi:hypothetical protein LQ318_08495 [Aliifodinibius salicampi]|uniref:Uncharacterized protein n=1 Tax=Fodinibius salicampi TaxID=1920655 RepID=A0ABT3PYK3_9BACT|nr:hypothetical protein [Fodinibius salicampi]MCW9712942.1 hypothetical protein [Fodinibius salicampi]
MSKRKKKKAKMTLKDGDGNIVKEVPLTEANDDWLRSGRVSKEERERMDKKEGTLNPVDQEE